MAAISLKKINRFALGEARTHKKFFIIVNIILGMGGVLYTLMSHINHITSSLYDGSSYVKGEEQVYFEPSVLGLAMLVVGGGIGLIGAALVFRDMNNIQIGDVQLSLPMSASERYFSKLLALCYIHVIPVILWTGIPSIINFIRCNVYGATEIRSISILCIFLFILVGTLFVDAVTILCTSCCGALAESLYFTLIAMFCLSVAPVMIWVNLTETCAGHSTDPGMIFSAWTLSFVVNIDDSGDQIPWLILNCLVSVAVMLLTLLIYRRRDARSLGTPISSRVFFECIMFASLMTAYSLFFFNMEAYIGIIIVGVTYIIIHIITSRGKLNAKSFLAWIGKFVASTLVYIGVAAIAYVTGGFGMISHLPIRSLDKAHIQINYHYYEDNSNTDVNFANNDYGSDKDSELTDEQVRQAARIYQKYVSGHHKSVGTFMSMLMNGNRYNYDSCNSTLYISKVKQGRDYTYHETIIEQSLPLTPEECEALDKELTGIDVLKRESYTDNYNDIDNKYPEEVY